MKPVKFSSHARWQMELKGASEEEVVHAIKSGEWEDAKMNKFQSRYRFDFNTPDGSVHAGFLEADRLIEMVDLSIAKKK
jgi:hypothetical protein